MSDKKEKDEFDFSYPINEAFRINRRIGFSKPRIGIFHCLIEGDGPGFLIDLYDEDNSDTSVCLYSLVGRDSQNINLQYIARRLANEIADKTGLNIKVINEIQGHRMEYNENDEKMWIARMAMQGIDDDY